MAEPLQESCNCLWASNAIAYGISIGVGVVAGAVVQYLLGALVAMRNASRVKQGAKFELRYIADTKVPAWTKQLGELRSRLTEGRLGDGYTNYFDIAMVPTGALNTFIQSGRAYTVLGAGGLSSLLQLLSEVTFPHQQTFNARAAEVRQTPDRDAAFKTLDFLDWKVAQIAEKANQADASI